jgi:predicted transcriptional regulator
VDIDTVGKTLFGNPVRLRLCIWIWLRDKDFFQSEPPREVGVQNAVRQELHKLEKLGMLRSERRDATRRVYYLREESLLWNIIASVQEVIEAQTQ